MPAAMSSPPAFQHLLFDLPEPEPPSVIHVRPRTRLPPRPVTSGSASSLQCCGPELIDSVLTHHGRVEQCCRQLPARLVVNAILLMRLKPTVSYQKLIYQLDAAVPPAVANGTRPLPPSPGPVGPGRVLGVEDEVPMPGGRVEPADQSDDALGPIPEPRIGRIGAKARAS